MPTPPPLNPLRLKTSLKMSLSKLKFLQEKKTALCKQQRRQLADLLRQGKESSATIRVENIIRDDIYIELLEYLELYCELLLARINLITDPAKHECDKSLLEAVSSVIYAANHTELKEVVSIKDWLIAKYGHEFGRNALENKDEVVPEKIVSRCSVEPPQETLVDLYLCEIARTYSAPYSKLSEYSAQSSEGEDNDDDDDNDGEGGTKELEAPLAADAKPKVKEQDEFDALKARFAALRTG
ncbi:uncharacterized protein SPAPADRAFT_61800 [Spathaspora passalidarum NRRL Y-27907]|uniref:DUF292-domain-containing protein n=1 Tax=Spathaspora passalidarum (strain NRRL Y-27907 / 11-Y1) TaxID=619300 RepID=G3AR49_SPAPN|nr:uncharacterized protein SPAPADRAFT_61800 [Spathaspora passalidarum NRRL Y-27907]EGW31224.1 hypothetical protein SPAPADRAFT_61800 [Spathaspora passalidarum NRRL Y-27907]